MDINDIIITAEYQQCLDLIEKETPVIFLSGQAGTGKSVLIQLIQQKFGNDKNIVKVAPTGVAALNVNGSTIHSVFRLPYGVITKERASTTANSIILKGMTDIFEKMDLLIIDEIPMTRADAVDALDIILRRIRHYDYPFGGVQVLMVGDLFQLPPIVTENDREIFNKYYGIEYFFGSNVFDDLIKYNMFESVMLTEIFRQKDEVFIKILNNIRVNRDIKTSIAALNEYCFNNPSDWVNQDDSIVLCTTNKKALEINTIELAKLTTPVHIFEAIIKDKFDVTSVITPVELSIREGAKVMFTKNNQATWVNGTIGIVSRIDAEGIWVLIPSCGSVVPVERTTWENREYTVDEATGRVVEDIVGTFTQYPLTLAYAVTIHKSQGLTFNHVQLDLGVRAFAHGQTYVGLSRCTSIDGIHLNRPVTPFDIMVDPRVVEFYNLLGYEV